ncbi:MAG: hypothetical protein ACLTWK_00085 [Eisenbergiella sp.]
MKVEIEMNESIYNLLNDYCYEMDKDINDFILSAISGKFNRENKIFKCKMKDGKTVETK